MKILVKRAYDAPAKNDGERILVDRLWPRGVKKEELRIAVWAKELAPSHELRRWLHADPEKRYAEFSKRYRDELKAQKTAAIDLLSARRNITLITAAKDIAHSHIPVLRTFLESAT